MAELTKLLGFMSSWDRQSAISRYEAMFDEARDPDVLMEELGTPTRVAVRLARDYVSTPPPPGAFPEPSRNASADRAEPGDYAPAAVTDSWEELEAELPPEEEEALYAEEQTGSGGEKRPGFAIRLLYWVFAIAVGVPVTAVLICLGVPFLVLGISVIAVVAGAVPGALGSFPLLSDVLFTAGSGLALLAVGLLLAWLGLWISVSLCRLWLEKILISLWQKIYRNSYIRPE